MPTPSRVVSAKEQLERLMATEPEHCARAAQLKADGNSYEEIARELNMHKDSVRRILKRLRLRANSESEQE